MILHRPIPITNSYSRMTLGRKKMALYRGIQCHLSTRQPMGTLILSLQSPRRDEEYEPNDRLPSYEHALNTYREHPTYGSYTANSKGKVFNMNTGKWIKDSRRAPGMVLIRDQWGTQYQYPRVRFVWECYWGKILEDGQGLFCPDGNLENCDIMNIDTE